MVENPTLEMEKWKRDLEAAWVEIPKAFRNEGSVRRTLQCWLYGRLREMGYSVVADYFPPRIRDRPIDIIALNREQEIVFAVCLDKLVTLAAVKSLSSFAAAHKVIYTTGPLEKKVQESRFFLKPDIEHFHLRPFGEPR